VASVIVTVIVGFAWGGWKTSSAAERMAENAAKDARAELVAAVCVERFLGAPDAQTQLAALKEANSWQRDTLITEGGWTKLPGVEEPVSQAAELCAEKLADATLSNKQAANDSAVITAQ
jgi:hypothetical protein